MIAAKEKTFHETQCNVNFMEKVGTIGRYNGSMSFSHSGVYRAHHFLFSSTPTTYYIAVIRQLRGKAERAHFTAILRIKYPKISLNTSQDLH